MPRNFTVGNEEGLTAENERLRAEVTRLEKDCQDWKEKWLAAIQSANAAGLLTE